MATYIVHLTTTASTSVEVEADSREEAENKAYDADMPTICAGCSGWGSSHNLEVGDDWAVSDITEPEED